MFFTFARAMDRSRDVATTMAPLSFGPDGPTTNDVQPFGGFAISATTRKSQACWTWLKYLSTDLASVPDGFPARTSLAESATFLQDALPGAADVYAAYQTAWQQHGTTQAPAFFQSPIDYFWFFQAVDRALQGEDLTQALAQAQTRTEQLLTCTQRGSRPDACAIEVDPRYDGWKNAPSP